VKTESFIGLRYLWNTRRTRFLSVITVICILGIAIGVTALISVQSIMDGLQNQMKKTILGAKTHISIEHSDGGFNDFSDISKLLLSNENIVGVTPLISRDVIFSSNDEMLGAVLNGIDPETAGSVLLLPSQITKGSMECLKSAQACPKTKDKNDNDQDTSQFPGIAIGAELAKYYSIGIGDIIKVISPVGGGMGPTGPVPLIRSFRIGAIFYSGLYEYDLNYGYITLKDSIDFFSTKGKIDSIGVKLADMYALNETQSQIKEFLPMGFIIKNWRDMNKKLFGALKMEKVIWFLILGFIILVAAFNIVSALVMMVMGKKIEIAILRAVGFTSRSVMKIFMLDGIIIGSVGTVIGLVLGFVICTFLDGLVLGVAKDVYYIETIPVDMSIFTFIYSAAGSLTLSLLATIYPGRKAAMMSPSEALRHD
jgi:lipoprotein-releasing system permease protein